jgi:hypothetical protein
VRIHSGEGGKLAQQENALKLDYSPLGHAVVVALHFILLTLLYWQTTSFDYVYFDDAEYVIENRVVSAGLTLDGVRWAFTTFAVSNWHPLTWLSHMLDVSLFGTSPVWAHIHNAVLHAFVSLLVYFFLIRLSASRVNACILSLVFLVHPLHVESVAWIAERKDLLCALFYMIALLIYDSHRAAPSRSKYLGVLLCFILALLSKPMAVTLPVVLLLLDYFVYRHPTSIRDNQEFMPRSWSYLITEKVPFILLSGAACAVTVIAQDTGGSVAHLDAHGIAPRIYTAIMGYVKYLEQSLLPVELAVYYPIGGFRSSTKLLVSAGIFLTLTGLGLWFARRLSLMSAGLAWYFVTLLPVIGLVQVSGQAHADRYMYIPSIGLLMAGLPILVLLQRKYLQLANALAVILIAYLSLLSFWQIGYWKNQQVLFSRALEVAGPNYKIHVHLAEGHLRYGAVEESRLQSMAALELRPDLPAGYYRMGQVALAEGEYGAAEHLFRATLTKGAPLPQVFNHLGIALILQDRLAEGLDAFREALLLDPGNLVARENLARYTALPN